MEARRRIKTRASIPPSTARAQGEKPALWRSL
jgi:hypothetical protein